MEILAYLYMALSYEQVQEENSECMRYSAEECPHNNLKNATHSPPNKSRCFFKIAKI